MELLPEDFTVEEYDSLLDEFRAFLERQYLISRGEFVDYNNLECTPKVGNIIMQILKICLSRLELTLWRTLTSATSTTPVRRPAS